MIEATARRTGLVWRQVQQPGLSHRHPSIRVQLNYNLLLLVQGPRSEMTAPIHHRTPTVVSIQYGLLRLQGHNTTLPLVSWLATLRLLGTSLTLSHALMPPQGITLQLPDFTSCYKFSHFVYASILLANYHHHVIRHLIMFACITLHNPYSSDVGVGTGIGNASAYCKPVTINLTDLLLPPSLFLRTISISS